MKRFSSSLICDIRMRSRSVGSSPSVMIELIDPNRCCAPAKKALRISSIWIGGASFGITKWRKDSQPARLDQLAILDQLVGDQPRDLVELLAAGNESAHGRSVSSSSRWRNRASRTTLLKVFTAASAYGRTSSRRCLSAAISGKVWNW